MPILPLFCGEVGKTFPMLELESFGIGNGWTIANDLMGEESVGWGLPGYTPRDRVATTGVFQFTLNNARTYAQEIFTDLPSCYFGLDDGKGSTYAKNSGPHSSVGPGLVSGGVVFGGAGVAKESAAFFDGVAGSGITVSDSVALAYGAGSFTAQAWVNSTEQVAGGGRNIVSKGHEDNTSAGWFLRRNAGGTNIVFGIGDGANSVTLTGTAVVAPNLWYLVTVVVDRVAQLARLYVGNIQVTSTSISTIGSVTSANPLLIGKDAGVISAFTGALQRIAVYPTALSATRITAHGNAYINNNGRYSPDHIHCRVGFQEGARVRYSEVAAGEKFTLHVGTLDSIIPEPDELGGDFAVRCASVDYMDDLARASAGGLAILQNVRDDQIFSALVASVPRQPDSIQTLPGPDTFEVALDKVDSATKIVSIMNDVALSSLAYIYFQGDTLVYEPRNVRASSTTPVDTFTSKLVGLELERARSNRLNRIEVTAHPRKVDASPTTIIYSLPTGNPVLIAANATFIFWTPYTDPNASGQAIGAIDVQTPALGSDYAFFQNPDGTGTNFSGNLSVSITPFASTAKLSFTNFGPDGYLTFLQVKGRGVYDYAGATLQAEDTGSQFQSGLNPYSLDAVYQSDLATAYEFAVYLVGIYGSSGSQVNRARFMCPRHDAAHAARLLRRRISDRVALGEKLTGLSTARHFFINAVNIQSDERNNLVVEWLLAPADTTAYWLLEVVGRSELDNTTRLGFGLVLGHTDIAHADTHGDVAHADSAHVDTHTDDAHQDVAHGDGAVHGDVAHSDTTHSDVGHQDASHQDAHNDVAHQDSAHVDSHSDVAHQDGAHEDIAHDDVAHADFPHEDFHGDHIDFPDFENNHSDADHQDVAHEDVSHADSHTDVAHNDSHNDVAHVDGAHTDTHTDGSHSDVAHGDIAHIDVAHSDNTSHADSAHADVAHADVAHVDTAHVDTAHSDAHTDVAHADIN